MATVSSFSSSIYETRLRDRQEIAEGTMAFYLQRPVGFEFKAEQSIAEEAAFMNELRQLAAENQNFRFIPSMTEMGKSRQSYTKQVQRRATLPPRRESPI